MTEMLRERTQVGPNDKALGGSAVVSVGVAVPSRAVPNREISARLGVDDRWIETRTGVRSRRIAEPSERLSALAAEAGRQALSAAQLDPAELDLVIVATISHDHLVPSASALVTAEIGARNAGGVDLNAACAGFVSALAVGAAQIESQRAKSVLIIGADLLSHLTDPDDRSTAGLLADGAGAVVMAGAGSRRVGPVVLGADGSKADLIWATRKEAIIRMNGADTFREAVRRLCKSTLEALDLAGRELEEIDLFVYHQANSRIIRAVGERLGLNPERVVDCLGKYGNTSAASVPLALSEAQSRGQLDQGTTALLAAFGGGLTWAATVIDWGPG